MRNYKVRMLEVMKGFNKKYLHDMKEYLQYAVLMQEKEGL